MSAATALRSLAPDALLVLMIGVGLYLGWRGLEDGVRGYVYVGGAGALVCALLLQTSDTLAKLATLASAAKAARDGPPPKGGGA